MTSKYYAEEPTFHVAVDCIVFGFDEGKLQVLFQRRSIEPYNGELTPLGGFVGEKETLDEAAYRVLTERTGIRDLLLEQLEAFGEINRDPGGRVISVAYYALLNKEHYNHTLLNKFDCQWVDIDNVPVLYFDHMKMLKKAIMRLQDKIGYTPIAMKLLPKEFTLSQIQKLYESILNEELDKRNFRKRVCDMPYFVKTDKIDKSGSKRGAAIYTFDYNRYNELRDYHL
ncbi:MAG: NUDIX hydrolase [Bacteroides sp.]|nr:NUDIX hydrolase [Bacteroides sp.]MCM1448429.1 NUDIX hydrolase [Bacteroides sp.]